MKLLTSLLATLLLVSCGPPETPRQEFPDDVERQADDLRTEYEVDDEYLLDAEQQEAKKRKRK